MTAERSDYRLGASRALLGVSVGCVNPEKDLDGIDVPRTVELLAGAFGHHERTEG